VKFLLVAVVVLPLLPDEPHGPYGILNPFKSGDGRADRRSQLRRLRNLALARPGPRAARHRPGRWARLVDGVTLAASQRAKASPELARGLGAVDLRRVGGDVAARAGARRGHQPRAAGEPHLAVRSDGAGRRRLRDAALLPHRKHKHKGDDPALTNPFELTSALKVRSRHRRGDARLALGAGAVRAAALYVTGLLAGLADVDAITLSLSTMAGKGEVTAVVAMGAILLRGGGEHRDEGRDVARRRRAEAAWRVAIGFAAMVTAGGAALAVKTLLTRE